MLVLSLLINNLYLHIAYKYKQEGCYTEHESRELNKSF